MSREQQNADRDNAAYPGGMIGAVPVFNPANTAYVERSNAEREQRPPYTSVQGADELPEADFYGEG